METKTGKVRVAKAEGRRKEERRGKKKEKRKNNSCDIAPCTEESRKEKKKEKKEKKMEVRKVAEKWEIWDKEEKAAKSEEEAKKLVPKQFHRWIKIFGKKASERTLMRKMWNHTIDLKEEFVPRKEKVYSLSREKREEVRKFVQE